MNLIDIAIADTGRIVSDPSEWGVEVKFTSPNSDTAEITGISPKIHEDYDMLGNKVNAVKASVTIQESLLTDLDYPVRISGRINMLGHQVEIKHADGISNKYVIREQAPDETLGIIIFFLGSKE